MGGTKIGFSVGVAAIHQSLGLGLLGNFNTSREIKLYINPTPNSETVSVMPVHSDVWPSTLETQTTLGI